MSNWPPLPIVLAAPGGAVSVRLVKRVQFNGEDVWGRWDPEKREVLVKASLALESQHWTLFHEFAHVALDDTGVSELMPLKLQEAVCTAVATTRLAELRRQMLEPA